MLHPAGLARGGRGSCPGRRGPAPRVHSGTRCDAADRDPGALRRSGPGGRRRTDRSGRERGRPATSGCAWRVAFCGFAPGFAYLVGGDRARSPCRAGTCPGRGSRRVRWRWRPGTAPSTPGSRPGGWQLIGRCPVPVWDLAADATGAAATRSGGPLRPRRRSGMSRGDRTPRELEVLDGGPMTTIQDQGRPGLAASAWGRPVPRTGPRRRWPTAWSRTAPMRRCSKSTLGGLWLRAGSACTLALSGADPRAELDGQPVGVRNPVAVPAGGVLRLGAPAVGAAHLRRGPRRHRRAAGPRIPLVRHAGRARAASAALGRPASGRAAATPVAARGPCAAPALGGFAGPAPAAARPAPGRSGCRVLVRRLSASLWLVGADSDRVGVRLDGPLLGSPGGASWPPEGLVRGAVQLPPGGQLVVMLADHPVTGGYPVIACLDDASADRLAQVRPGTACGSTWPGRLPRAPDGPDRAARRRAVAPCLRDDRWWICPSAGKGPWRHTARSQRRVTHPTTRPARRVGPGGPARRQRPGPLGGPHRRATARRRHRRSRADRLGAGDRRQGPRPGIRRGTAPSTRSSEPI